MFLSVVREVCAACTNYQETGRRVLLLLSEGEMVLNRTSDPWVMFFQGADSTLCF